MKNERAYYAVVELLTHYDAEQTAFSIINSISALLIKNQTSEKATGKQMYAGLGSLARGDHL